jgi:hypothetical protein
MRLIPVSLMLVFCLADSGCSLFTHTSQNLTNEVCRYTSDLKEMHRYRQMAEDALASHCAEAHYALYSLDYSCGFKEGYVDYLFWGNPHYLPAAPPEWYWKHKPRTAEDAQAIQAWFDGFREGQAAAVAEHGQRQGIVVPLKFRVPVCPPEHAHPALLPEVAPPVLPAPTPTGELPEPQSG